MTLNKQYYLKGELDKLVGQTEATAIQVMGTAPKRSSGDGQGGKILVWERYGSHGSSVTNTTYGYYTNGIYRTPGSQGVSSFSSVEDRSFIEIFVNSRGIVYRVNDSSRYTDKVAFPRKKGWYYQHWYGKCLWSMYSCGVIPLIYGLPSNAACHKWFNRQPRLVQYWMAGQRGICNKWYRKLYGNYIEYDNFSWYSNDELNKYLILK